MDPKKFPYPMPEGMHTIPLDLLDLRPDSDVNRLITNPPPVTSEKNVWFFWDKGFDKMDAYARRNVRAWHRRFAPLGWTIRVVDVYAPTGPSSRGLGHICNFLDTSDSELFPRAFHEGSIEWEYQGQMYSDLVRFPLLLTYGGVYADVTFLQIGDVDALWNATIADSSSPYEVLLYNYRQPNDVLVQYNFFLAARPQNPFFLRAHRLLLELWGRDGGRQNPNGLIKDPLMKAAPVLIMPEDIEYVKENPLSLDEAFINLMGDYALQMVVMTLVSGTVDAEDGWNGPKYADEHVFGLDSAEHAQLTEVLTSWSGKKGFELLSLALPADGEEESEKQTTARNLVEALLMRSFGMKLVHGPVSRVFGETLGLHWRRVEGADDVVGTYAHWLRYAMNHWTQDKFPERIPPQKREPLQVGSLMKP